MHIPVPSLSIPLSFASFLLIPQVQQDLQNYQKSRSCSSVAWLWFHRRLSDSSLIIVKFVVFLKPLKTIGISEKKLTNTAKNQIYSQFSNRFFSFQFCLAVHESKKKTTKYPLLRNHSEIYRKTRIMPLTFVAQTSTCPANYGGSIEIPRK